MSTGFYRVTYSFTQSVVADDAAHAQAKVYDDMTAAYKGSAYGLWTPDVVELDEAVALEEIDDLRICYVCGDVDDRYSMSRIAGEWFCAGCGENADFTEDEDDE